MKKFFSYLAIFAMILVCVSCGSKEEQATPDLTSKPVTEPAKQEVYQPVHKSENVNAMRCKKYNYFAAPLATPATSVQVDYTTPYKSDVIVKYTYANGDTYTYTIAKTYGLWTNAQTGNYKVICDDKCTVWLQGQTYTGGFHEFVFYADPALNGTKIKPNSFKNLPAGEIKYRK